ncbi:Protein arg11 [Trichinella spiralis]|uniref:Protein arg11 n=1 Tax=Trichinella spiralis TaxID=6334 RepID=A0ABR3L3C1_TRISP
MLGNCIASAMKTHNQLALQSSTILGVNLYFFEERTVSSAKFLPMLAITFSCWLLILACIVSSSGAQFTCGQFVYDARRFICCENTDLCKRDGTRDCCGRFCYNPTIDAIRRRSRCAATAKWSPVAPAVKALAAAPDATIRVGSSAKMEKLFFLKNQRSIIKC